MSGMCLQTSYREDDRRPTRDISKDAAVNAGIRKGSTIFGLTPSGIWYIVTTYAKTLSFKVSPHDLRRTYTALSDEGGADLRQIQAELGHASIQTTERYLNKIKGIKPGKAAGDHFTL